MKKVLLICGFILFANLSFAQDYSIEEAKVTQNLFGAEKKAIIQSSIDLSGVDSPAFWELYQEYEVTRKEIGEKRIALLQQYQSIGAISDKQANEVVRKAEHLRKSEDELIKRYSSRIKHATTAIVGAQFYQLEHFISAGVRFTILNNMQFIQDKN